MNRFLHNWMVRGQSQYHRINGGAWRMARIAYKVREHHPAGGLSQLASGLPVSASQVGRWAKGYDGYRQSIAAYQALPDWLDSLPNPYVLRTGGGESVGLSYEHFHEALRAVQTLGMNWETVYQELYTCWRENIGAQSFWRSLQDVQAGELAWKNKLRDIDKVLSGALTWGGLPGYQLAVVRGWRDLLRIWLDK